MIFIVKDEHNVQKDIVHLCIVCFLEFGSARPDDSRKLRKLGNSKGRAVFIHYAKVC